MKKDEIVIAEAKRIEIDELNDKVYIVFEVIDHMTKQNIKETWLSEIEYKLINKKLYENK